MRKIIDGRRYDTDTAKKIWEHEPIENMNDINYYRETLYQKNNGELFMHCVGNAGSKHNKPSGANCRRGSETINPIDYYSARQWALERMPEDQYNDIFGEVDVLNCCETKREVCICMTESERKKIKQNAAKCGLSVSAYILSMCLEMKETPGQ